MDFKLLFIFFVLMNECNREKNGNQTTVAAVDEEAPLPPPSEGIEGPTRATAGFTDYDILKAKIVWQRELKGKGSGTYLQLPPDRLPSKFKPYHKYYLAFGSPDYSYRSCPKNIPCRFLEHCKPTAKFFNSFATFAASACLIGENFIGVCCNNETSSATGPFKCGELNRFVPKVVGGEPAEKDDWPWMAAILDSDNNQQFCGGVLISNKYVLTAAHCLKKIKSPNDVLVRLGEYDFSFRSSSGKDFRVSRIKLHEQYNNTLQLNDIALLTLSTTVTFSKSIRHICLPKKASNVEEVNSFVTGWGRICQFCDSSSKLLELYLPTWKQSLCVSTYARFEIPVDGRQLCAGFKEGGRDSCQGDSGGPLMTMDDKNNWMVIGIVSYGKGCAQPNAPGIYTRVSSYIDWIQLNARN